MSILIELLGKAPFTAGKIDKCDRLTGFGRPRRLIIAHASAKSDEARAFKPEPRFLPLSLKLAQVVTEIRDTDQEYRRQVDRSKDQSEAPKIFPAHIPAAVINRAGARGVRRDDAHQSEGVAE